MSAAARPWRPPFSPRGRWSGVSPHEVRDRLRRAFARWGRPLQLRVDNGTPWGSKGDLPTDLALWLIGLGVDLHWNRPGQSTDNAVVERGHGVGDAWGEPHAQASAAQLEGRMAEMDRIQREEYPARDGRTRLEVYPGLAHSGRPYSAAWEGRHGSLRRVLDYLGGVVVRRRVDRKGMASVYNRNYYVGVRHAGREVYLSLDPQRRSWVFSDERGQQLRELPAEQLTRQRVVGLTVSKRRPRHGPGPDRG
jgi:hypothetical protein